MTRELNDNWSKRIQLALAVFIVLLLLCRAASAGTAVVKNIRILDNPLSVQVDMTTKVPAKVIPLNQKELLVALKNAVLAKNFKLNGRRHPAIKEISVDTLQGNVVGIVVTSRFPHDVSNYAFDGAGRRFVVKFTPAEPTPRPLKPAAAKPVAAKPAAPPHKAADTAKARPAKAKPDPKKDAVPATVAKATPAPPLPVPAHQPPPEPKAPAAPEKPKFKPLPQPVAKNKKSGVKTLTPPVYVPPKREKSEFKGDINDLYRVIAKKDCASEQIDNAILLIKKELFQEAHDLLDQYVFQENFVCLEEVYYLRAYVYYKSLEKEDYAGLIKAERMLQDALVLYPKSEYIPYAYAAIGKVHTDLKNNSAAEGYFNIVMQGYASYSGIPEVLFHLAKIYDEKGYTDKALRYYRQVFESPLDNSYIPAAGVGYGKALFKKQQYYNALTVFNYVVKQDVKKIYESPELLLHMGEANFELGLGKESRENFVRAMNLFTEIPDRDVILAKVGDTYGMEDKIKKAIKLYELTREKYPDSQGYVNASIGIARYLKTDGEKIEIYEMIKNRFPDNTYARIAMMRLAEIYQKNGEYNKCIKEIEDLLSTHPTGLRYEAMQLMQKAYEALFEQQLKEDAYTSVLNRYESEHMKIDKMDSRKIAFLVGLAYLKGNLYEEAFNHLLNAYKLYKRSERSPGLYYALGVAMDESGRDGDALKMFDAFSKRFKKHKDRVDALARMGKIHLAAKRFKKASDSYKRAYAASRNALVKGHILMQHSDVHAIRNDLKTAANLREKAVKEFAAASGKNYEVLTQAYKTLGNTYLGLTSYVQAADAFSKALSFSDGEREKANIGFLLGDAYQKGNIIEKAKKAFQQVATTYDSVWARLARQRLNTLELAETVLNS